MSRTNPNPELFPVEKKDRLKKSDDPNIITTRTSAEFFRALALAESGEFTIYRMEAGLKKNNAGYRLYISRDTNWKQITKGTK